MYGPPLFFWVMLTLMVAGFAWAVVAAFRRRAALAVLGVALGVIIGLTIWSFASMGAFCVPPPGSACL